VKSRQVKRAEAPKPPAFIASAAISKDRNRGAGPYRSDVKITSSAPVSRNSRAGFRAQNRNFILDERFSRINRKSSDILVCQEPIATDVGPPPPGPALSSQLPRCRFSRTLKGMEVHFSPDVETRLQQLAFANGKDAEQLVKDTVTRMLENQARFIAEVQRGIEQADHGEFVEHKEVRNRIDRLFHP
jgi:predicted transcriptional regulator